LIHFYKSFRRDQRSKVLQQLTITATNKQKKKNNKRTDRTKTNNSADR